MIKMNNEILEIKQSLKELHLKIDLLLENQRKMNNHVDFVENVYTTVQRPLNFICNRFNGNKTTTLPTIEYEIQEEKLEENKKVQE